MADHDITVRDPWRCDAQAREIPPSRTWRGACCRPDPMRLVAAAAVLLLATTSAFAQPGATDPQPGYGPPPPAPTSQPTYAPPDPAPQGAEPYPPQGHVPQQQYPAPQQHPAPQQYPAPQPYPAQQPQPYPAPRPYSIYQQGYQPQPYPAYAQPVGGLTKPVAPRPLKKESTATWLSIGATAAGLGAMYLAAQDHNENLAIAGLAVTLIGPSAGHLYAGENGHAVKMSLLRTGGLVMMIYGGSQDNTAYDCIDYCQKKDGQTAILVGGAVILGATLYDFYDAGRAARRTNEKAARALTVGPTMMSSSGGRSSPGVALSGSF
jgi:hypothetical protein